MYKSFQRKKRPTGLRGHLGTIAHTQTFREVAYCGIIRFRGDSVFVEFEGIPLIHKYTPSTNI